MGWWRMNSGAIIGDAPANIVDGLKLLPAYPVEIPRDALLEIKRCYVTEFGREPTEYELRELLLFCKG